jgi:hypothetical protein
MRQRRSTSRVTVTIAMPHVYVHTGFWTKYDAPLYTKWPLTLSNLQAVVLFCVVGIVLTYMQARA